MNPWQTALQLRHLLRLRKWADGLGDLVFGDNVFVYAGAVPDEQSIPAGFPFAMVGLDSKTHDPDEPGLLTQNFSVIIAQEVLGDPLGEHAVIGGSRLDDYASAGAGLGEVVEQALIAIQDLTGLDGQRMLVSASGSSASAAMVPGRHCAYEQLSLTALCTTEEFYEPPQQVNRAGSVWTWVGEQCSNRFDFVRYQIGYVTGATPATNFLDVEGTVYQGTETTATFSAVSGRAYSVFAEYAPRGGTRRRYSPGNVTGAFVAT